MRPSRRCRLLDHGERGIRAYVWVQYHLHNDRLIGDWNDSDEGARY